MNFVSHETSLSFLKKEKKQGAYQENIQNFHPYTHYERKKCRRRARVEELIFASGVNAVDSSFP
jgi:hypothetical protein